MLYKSKKGTKSFKPRPGQPDMKFRPQSSTGLAGIAVRRATEVHDRIEADAASRRQIASRALGREVR